MSDLLDLAKRIYEENGGEKSTDPSNKVLGKLIAEQTQKYSLYGRFRRAICIRAQDCNYPRCIDSNNGGCQDV